MSLWSDIGDVFEGAASAGRNGLGFAWDVATAVGGSTEVQGVKSGATLPLQLIGQAYDRSPSEVKDTVHGAVQPFIYTGRAASTALQVTGIPIVSSWGSILSDKGESPTLLTADNPLDAVSTAWKNSKTTSPGQAALVGAGAAPEGATFANAGSYGAGGKNYNPWFSYASGTADLVASWYADPFVLAGKGVKVAKDARNVVRPGDLAAIKAGEDGAKLGTRQKAVANRFDSLVRETDGKNTAQLLQYGFLRDNEAGDTIASLIAAANKRADDEVAQGAVAHEVKATRDSRVKDILRVGMGDMDTLARLKAENDTLAFDMENLNQSLDWMTDAATSPLASGRMTERLSQKIADTQAEIGARESYQRELDKFLDPQNGAYGRLGTRIQGANVFDRHRLNQLDRTSRVGWTVLQDGLGSTPVHVFKTDHLLGARPAGVVDLNNAADVNIQLGHQMQRVKGLDPETKQHWLSRVGDANDDASRQVVVQQIEDQVFMHVARQVLGDDVKRETVDAILKDYRLKHADAAQKAYPQQAFSGGVDPQTGRRIDEWWEPSEGAFMARPVMSTQLANSLPLMDVDEVYRVLKRSKHEIKAYEYAYKGKDLADALATGALTWWKFGKLARLGYPMRSIADAQLRMIATLGGAAHALEVTGPGIRNLAHNVVTKGEKRHLGMGEVKVGGYTFTDLHGKTAKEYEASMHKIDAKQTFENVLVGEQQSILKVLRSSGEFVERAGNDPLYELDWVHAANNQIRQNPLARQILAHESGASSMDPVSWLKRTPEGRSEAKRMRPIYDNDYEEMVRKHDLLIDNVTDGDDGLRLALAERDVTAADLKKAFPTTSARPTIHGEMLDAAANKGAAAAAKAAMLKGFYKVTSDIPETQLGRHPMAVIFFRRHLKDLVDHADPKGLGTLEPDDLERIRTAAVSLARRDMKRTLYNISSQPNLAAGMWKFIFPFFGAFQDVALKYGKLIYDDPARLARANLVLDAPNRAGITVDKDGNIVGPGHPLGDGQFIVVPSIPGFSSIAKWKLSKQSANVVLAGDPVWLPGFGPLMGVSANEVAKRYPRTESMFDKAGLLPFGAQESSFNMVNPAPTWGVQLWRASHPDNAEYREVYAQILASESMAIRDGSRKNPGEQELLDEVGSRTSAWFMARAVANFGMPLSATPITKYQLYFDLAHKYQDPAWQKQHPELFRTIDPKTGAATPVAASEAFYRDHPQYFDAMVSLSKNNTGIQATNEGVDASKRWSKEIAKFPEFGAMFVGPEDEGEFSSAARANQLSTRVGPGTSERFREKKDPVQAMKDINVSRGWITYRQWADKIDVALATRKAQGGSDSLAAKANGDLKIVKDTITGALARQNTDWYYDFQQRDQSRLPKFLAAARVAVTSPNAKGRQDLEALRLYMGYRERFQAALLQRTQATDPTATKGGSINAEGNEDLAQAWGTIVSELKSKYVTFSDIYTRNLENDDLTTKAVE